MYQMMALDELGTYIYKRFWWDGDTVVDVLLNYNIENIKMIRNIRISMNIKQQQKKEWKRQMRAKYLYLTFLPQTQNTFAATPTNL